MCFVELTPEQPFRKDSGILAVAPRATWSMWQSACPWPALAFEDTIPMGKGSRLAAGQEGPLHRQRCSCTPRKLVFQEPQ